MKSLVQDSKLTGAPLELPGLPICCLDSHDNIAKEMRFFQERGVNIVVVLMVSDCYSAVKLAADRYFHNLTVRLTFRQLTD